MLPTITEEEPAAKAFVTSPDVLIPPSEIIGTSCFFPTFAQSRTAVN